MTSFDSGGLGTWRTGGCGAKLEREALVELVRDALPQLAVAGLLMDLAEPDDASAVILPGGDTVLASLDFAPPVSRDPMIAGSVGAINALNDIWACGGRPLIALAILGVPPEAELHTVSQLLKAASHACRRVGVAVTGGHTIRSSEPLFGLAVVGLGDPQRLWKLSGARAGDVLVLTKELGSGMLISAARHDPSAEVSLRESAERLTADHAAAVEALTDEPVHAATDVSGFGLVGHAANLAEGSELSLQIDAAAVPLLPAACELATQGHTTSITAANVRDHRIRFTGGSPSLRNLLHDPQTAGPLLLALPADAAPRAVQALHNAGYNSASIIGTVGKRTEIPVIVHAT